MGQRVLLQVDGNTVQGIVRYCGPTHFASNVMVGCELPRSGPLGGRVAHSGSVDGVEYFHCETGRALWQALRDARPHPPVSAPPSTPPPPPPPLERPHISTPRRVASVSPRRVVSVSPVPRERRSSASVRPHAATPPSPPAASSRAAAAAAAAYTVSPSRQPSPSTAATSPGASLRAVGPAPYTGSRVGDVHVLRRMPAHKKPSPDRRLFRSPQSEASW